MFLYRKLRPMYHRSISDSSIHSVPSYVTAIIPSAQDLVQWHKQKKIYQPRDETFNLEQFPIEVPPSLPHLSGLECSTCTRCGGPNLTKVGRNINRRTLCRQDHFSDSSSYA